MHQQYEWLVIREATRYFTNYPSCREDILQECRIALLRAFQKYDDTKGIPFIPYAARVISRAAQRYVMNECRRGIGGGCRSTDAYNLKFASFSSDLEGGGADPDLWVDDYQSSLHWTDQQWDWLFLCLTEIQQKVVKLKLFDKHSNREVGEILGFHETRARFIWQQSLMRMREHIAYIDNAKS